MRAEAGGLDVADPRKLVEQVMESSGQHRAPDHAPSRALRVLENAAHIDAIVTVSSGLMPIGLQSSSEAQIANEALRPLSGGGALGPAGRGQRDPALGLALGVSRTPGVHSAPLIEKPCSGGASEALSGLEPGRFAAVAQLVDQVDRQPREAPVGVGGGGPGERDAALLRPARAARCPDPTPPRCGRRRSRSGRR